MIFFFFYNKSILYFQAARMKENGLAEKKKKRSELDIVIAAAHVNRSIRSSEIKREMKNENWKER